MKDEWSTDWRSSDVYLVLAGTAFFFFVLSIFYVRGGLG